jgi:hypothetical protein
MNNENCAPSSIPITIRSELIDTQSTHTLSSDKASNQSSLDNLKSSTIKDASQYLPSILNEISVDEILSTDEKNASVSNHEEPRRHTISFCLSTETDHIPKKQSKMDLNDATRQLTRLLHIGNDNTTTKDLNPDAPDFKPIDFTSTYHSEFAPAHSQRRATQGDLYNDRHLRTRYHSATHPNRETLTSTIRPLLSIVPQYISKHRKSWSTATPSLSNSWRPQESNDTSSYHSRVVYQPLINEKNYSYNKPTSKRQRAHSGRTVVYPNQSTMSRQRSYSGPETFLQSPSTHLSGIHSLTRIMVDILRMINPIPEEEKQNDLAILSSNLTSCSPVHRKHQRPSSNYEEQYLKKERDRNTSIQAEDVVVDGDVSTTPSPLLLLSVDKPEGSFLLIKLFLLHLFTLKGIPHESTSMKSI